MRFVLLAFVLFLSACAQSGYKKSYIAYRDASSIPKVELLTQHQTPKIIKTEDFDKDGRYWQSKQYIPLGVSSFNGDLENTDNAKEQAKQVGATLVLLKTQLTYKWAKTTTLPHDGNSSELNETVPPYAIDYSNYPNRSPVGKHFNQTALFLVKSHQKLKYGIQLRDPYQGMNLSKPEGALIDIVIENSPAAQSNIRVGDVLVKVDGKQVKNAKHATKLLYMTPKKAETSTLTILRNKQEREIKVKFDKSLGHS